MKEESIELDGVVIEALPNSMFKVKLKDDKIDRIILAHISGKIRKNLIRIIPGDEVVIQMSMYDLTKGRIVTRK